MILPKVMCDGVSKRIESTAQIAGKLHKSISMLVAYIINDTYSLSGDMQYMCCYGLSLKYVSSTCNISNICSKAFSLLVNNLPSQLECVHLLRVVVSGLPMTIIRSSKVSSLALLNCSSSESCGAYGMVSTSSSAPCAVTGRSSTLSSGIVSSSSLYHI